jgi:hypothetical protein
MPRQFSLAPPSGEEIFVRNAAANQRDWDIEQAQIDRQLTAMMIPVV